jgi:small subunit ribosomal protein S20
MANHPSAAKRHRQAVRREAVNRSHQSRLRNAVKEVENAIASGNKEAARSAFAVAQPALQRGVRKGIIHRSTASRKLSRLSIRIKAL